MSKFEIGQRVRINDPGDWSHGMTGRIIDKGRGIGWDYLVAVRGEHWDYKKEELEAVE